MNNPTNPYITSKTGQFMKWLDPKTHPIPQDSDELFIAYVFEEKVQKKYVVIAKKDNAYSDENAIETLNECGHLDYWFSNYNDPILLAWMPLPLPPEESSCPEIPDNSLEESR